MLGLMLEYVTYSNINSQHYPFAIMFTDQLLPPTLNLRYFYFKFLLAWDSRFIILSSQINYFLSNCIMENVFKLTSFSWEIITSILHLLVIRHSLRVSEKDSLLHLMTLHFTTDVCLPNFVAVIYLWQLKLEGIPDRKLPYLSDFVHIVLQAQWKMRPIFWLIVSFTVI